jgi:hypothetical protein
MRRSIWAGTILASLGFAAQANDGVELSLKSKAFASASASVATVAAQAQGPFSSGHDPLPEMMLREEQDRRGFQGTCQHSSNALCYDLADRRISLRAARHYMPAVEGIKPESISLRHNKVIFKYSFR